MKVTRRTSLALFGAAIATPVFAATPKTFTGADGFAINGYDPVGYFKASEPVKGSMDYKSEHEGATYLFASAENKAEFDADPTAFAPQYGGYCAYAVSRGYTAETDPDAWTIDNGKLYLNYSKIVRALWARDIPGNVAKADENWPSVLT